MNEVRWENFEKTKKEKKLYFIRFVDCFFAKIKWVNKLNVCLSLLFGCCLLLFVVVVWLLLLLKINEIITINNEINKFKLGNWEFNHYGHSNEWIWMKWINERALYIRYGSSYGFNDWQWLFNFETFQVEQQQNKLIDRNFFGCCCCLLHHHL